MAKNKSEIDKLEKIIVNEDLIKNPLCTNIKLGGEGGSYKGINKGRTKDKDPGKMRTVEKLTGRTKETHEYLRIIGEKNSKNLKGRTKETHEHVAKWLKHYEEELRIVIRV